MKLFNMLVVSFEKEEEQTIEVNGQTIKINPYGTARGTDELSDDLPEEGYKRWQLTWKDMNLNLETEMPSDWKVEENVQTGWQTGFTFSNGKALLHYFYAGIAEKIDTGLPEDSYYLVDALLSECIGNRFNNGYKHIVLANRKAGYSLSFDTAGTPCLLFSILNGDHALFLTVTDSDNFTKETMNYVIHSLTTLNFTELDSYTQIKNGYVRANMTWSGMNFKATTEVPSGWKMKQKSQGWQQGLVLYSNEKMLNLFYFYAGHESLLSDEIRDNPDMIIDMLFANFMGARKYNVSYTHYAGKAAGRSEVTFDNGSPGILTIILNGNYALYLLAEVSKSLDYNEAVENIINHSLETLVFSEVE